MNKLQCTNTISAQIVETWFAAWHSTENEVVPCSQYSKIKDIVRHEDIF